MRYLLETSHGQSVRIPHEVHKATGSGNKDVATLLQLLTLVFHWSTTVHHARAQHGTIAETTRFIEDLTGQLASWADDKDERLSTNTRLVSGRTWSLKHTSLAHQLGEDRQEEGCSLAGTYGSQLEYK